MAKAGRKKKSMQRKAGRSTKPAKPTKPRCITPTCTGIEYARGLCTRCYRTLARKIASGHVKEADAIRNGIIKKAKPRGRDLRSTPMGKALEQMKIGKKAAKKAAV